MIAFSIWQLCFYAWILHKGLSVRIFNNVIPKTLPTRHVPYKAHVISETCMLKPEKGPCRGGIKMYYYNNDDLACNTFTWGGCQGNGNRFDTEEECLDKCLSKKDAPRQRPNYCLLTYDYGYCFGSAERWYYDHVWKTCKKAIYSGCGGNENNFIYKEQCESICLFRKGVIKQRTTGEAGPKKVVIINPNGNNPK